MPGPGHRMKGPRPKIENPGKLFKRLMGSSADCCRVHSADTCFSGKSSHHQLHHSSGCCNGRWNVWYQSKNKTTQYKERNSKIMKQIKTLTTKNLAENLAKKGCGECQTSCQSACKTSCTVANQKCEQK